MGVLRLLLLLTIAWIVWRFFLRALLAPGAQQRRGTGEQDYLPLTRCSVCGVHIPQPQGNAASVCERCSTR